MAMTLSFARQPDPTRPKPLQPDYPYFATGGTASIR
jgi:hypothetical protein